MKDEYLIEMELEANKGNDILDYNDEEIDFYVACYNAYMAGRKKKKRQMVEYQEDEEWEMLN